MREIELPLVGVLAAMEREGLRLDAERLAKVGAGFGERIDQLETDIYELAGEEFTIGSPQQVGRILFEKLELTRKRRGKTGFSTDARVLAQIRDEHPIVEKIESWRELTKLKNTYLDSLPDLIDPGTGRVHTTFNQAATTTGRLSSTNPNLQNIPIRTDLGRPVRACFVAAEGARLLSADYSQVELRVLAHVADEQVLKDVFHAGEDVHSATAAEVFEIRPTRSTSASARNRGHEQALHALGLQPQHHDDVDVLQAAPHAVVDLDAHLLDVGRHQGRRPDHPHPRAHDLQQVDVGARHPRVRDVTADGDF